MRNLIVSFENEEGLKVIGDKLNYSCLTKDIEVIDTEKGRFKKWANGLELKSYAKIKFIFDDSKTNKVLSEIFEQPINGNVVEIQFPKKITKTRTIKCRFANLDDMKELLEIKLGLQIYKEGKIIKQFDFTTSEVKYKNLPKPKANKKYKWEEHWNNMPEFNIDFAEEEYGMVEFICDYNNENLKEILKQNITDKTKSVWFPKLIQGKHRKLRVVGGRHPRYPIYVVSKGRYNFSRNTSNFLSRMMVKHYIVVEPQEVELYKQHMDLRYCTVLELDMSYKDNYDRFDEEMSRGFGTGPGASRNFVKDHSTKNGFAWHWVENSQNREHFLSL